MESVLEPGKRPGWILAAGVLLALLGLAAQTQDEPKTIPPAVPGYGSADSNDQMIAVSGIDVTGGSLLYIVDTQNRHLSVYQATGGTTSTMQLKWIGGRNIDLDLQVDGFNDKSEFSYKELARQFEDGEGRAPDEGR
jgi:hypothetical protein